MRNYPLMAVAKTPQLRAGHEEYAPALQPSAGIPQPVSLPDWRLQTDNGIISPTPDKTEVIKTAAKTLSDEELVVEEARPMGIEQTYDIYGADRCGRRCRFRNGTLYGGYP